MKRILTVLVAAAFATTTITPASAKDAWNPDNDPISNSGFQVDWANGNDLLYIDEEGNMGKFTYAFIRSKTGEWSICEEPGEDFTCGVDNIENFGGLSLLPACESKIENCIEAISVSSSEASESPAVLGESTPGFSFPGIESIGVPRGSGPLKFTSDVRHSSGGQDYAAVASLKYNLNFDDQNNFTGYNPDEFSIRIFAVTERSDPRAIVPTIAITDTPDGKGMAPGGGGATGCVYQDVGMCAVEQEFAPGTVFTVSVILTNRITGWFRGRLQDPVIRVEPVNDSFNRVTIKGDSVEVPRFLSQFSRAAGDPDIVGPPQENAHGGQYTIFESATERAMEIVNGMRSKLNDTATAVSTVWSINSINVGRALDGQGKGYECFSDNTRVLGIVTTNAMTYTGLVPQFKDGFLSYKVAGLHYKPDGQSLNLGTYDMVMRSDVARCLYGYSKAPVSATVAVVGEQGEENIATTVVSERDGWLKLAAYGFTFSEKEIRAQIKQAQTKTLTTYRGSATSLTSKQKAEIKATVSKGGANPKFICTGIRFEGQPQSLNILVRKRAKLACDYAKSLNPKLSTFYQTKTTKARSYNGKVLVVSK